MATKNKGSRKNTKQASNKRIVEENSSSDESNAAPKNKKSNKINRVVDNGIIEKKPTEMIVPAKPDETKNKPGALVTPDKNTNKVASDAKAESKTGLPSKSKQHKSLPTPFVTANNIVPNGSETLKIPQLDVNNKRWSLVAKVIKIGQPGTIEERSSGIVSVVTLEDTDGHTIQGNISKTANGFWHSHIRVGKTYRFTNGLITKAKTSTTATSPVVINFIKDFSKFAELNGDNTEDAVPIKKNSKGDNNSLVDTCTSIASLNSKPRNASLYAKVVYKGERRHIESARFCGDVMDVILIDQEGTDIKATLYNDAIEKYEERMTVNGCYIISNFLVKQADEKFNFCKSNNVISFINSTEIVEIENGPLIADKSYNFVPINELEPSDNPNAFVDIIGIATSVGKLQEGNSSNTGKPWSLRTVTLTDMSGEVIEIPLWSEDAIQAAERFKDEPVVIFHRVRVFLKDFVMKMSVAGYSIVNPTMPMANELKEWWLNRK